MNFINEMMKLITSKWITASIYTAVKLSIPDILDKEAKTVKELAKETGTIEPYLYRILRALSGAEIFRELPGKVFENTPKSESLMNNKLGPIVLMMLSEWHNKAWDKLPESIKTGKIAFEIAHNTDAYNWLLKNQNSAKIFNEANAQKTLSIAQSFLKTYDFSDFKSVTDIGGGSGRLIIEILKQYPQIKGIVADSLQVIEQAKTNIEKEGLRRRCMTIPFDFFNSIPEESTVFILSNILHNWNNKKCGIILDNLRKAMLSESKLLIIEMIVPETNEHSIAKWMDLEMLVMGGGQERTKAEYSLLLKNSRIKLNRIISCGDYSVLECTP